MVLVYLTFASLKISNVLSPIINCLAFFYAGGIASTVLLSCNQLKNKKRINGFLIGSLICTFGAINQLNTPAIEQYIQPLLVTLIPPLLFLLGQEIMLPKKIESILEMAGNLTYSSYLLHFPLQLLVATIYTYYEISIPAFDKRFFIAYILITLIASYFTYWLFEKPIQSSIRNKFQC